MTVDAKTGIPFPRGARPSPRHKLLAAEPHRVVTAPPPQFALIPAKLDMWGNDRYGDCVSAEEAFAKACYQPEIFIDAQTVIAWAQHGGFRDGANLTEVMDAMKSKGFVVGSQTYDNGPYAGVDYANENVLQSAISQGPVKVSIEADSLPRGAGNQQGWYITGSASGRNQDHCVALCGYGPAGWLYQQLNVPLPSALQPTQAGYLLYTWSTIGFVDFAWVKSVVGEAWVRNPTTVGVPPLPGPTPVPPVPPVPPPTPTPTGHVTLPPFPVISLFGIHIGHTPGATIPVMTTDAEGVIAIPPWLLMLIKAACMFGPTLIPPPWNLIVNALCGFVPHAEKQHAMGVAMPTFTLPPWFWPIVRFACAELVMLPDGQWKQLAQALCSLVPKGDCGACK